MTCPLCAAGYPNLGGMHVNVTLGQQRKELGPCTASEDEQRKDPAGLLARFHDAIQACKVRVEAARRAFAGEPPPPPPPHTEPKEPDREPGQEG